MKVVVAPDKFKGSLTAQEAAAAIARGVAAALPGCEVVVMPIADGGEGTMDLLAQLVGAERCRARVTGPLGDAVEAAFGRAGDLAVVEMSAASGLQLVPPAMRDPWRATTFGTGELIAAALDGGARRVIVGIGGSATNDGGAGMAEALGYRFRHGEAGVLEAIEPPNPRPGDRASFRVACDVTNPLLGDAGCTRVYGPQKGIARDDFERHEARLARLAAVVARDVADVPVDVPGAGAAGGLGFGLMAFCGAQLTAGFDLVADLAGLREAVDGADLVITGEGSMDAQTLMGKGPAGVAELARRHRKPVLALCGIARDTETLAERFDRVASLERIARSPEDSQRRAAALLEQLAEKETRDFAPC